MIIKGLLSSILQLSCDKLGMNLKNPSFMLTMTFFTKILLYPFQFGNIVQACEAKFPKNQPYGNPITFFQKYFEKKDWRSLFSGLGYYLATEIGMSLVIGTLIYAKSKFIN